MGLLGSGRGDKVLIPELRRTRLRSLLSPASGSPVESSLEPVSVGSSNTLITVQFKGVYFLKITFPLPIKKIIFSPEGMDFITENKQFFLCKTYQKKENYCH